MNKYWSIFKISFQQEFAYRLNFIMWRVRNVIQVFLIFFLWNTIFSDPSQNIFGYNREKIITYVFGILVVRAIVLSARAVDISNDIIKGDISNYFLKPISYFKYWFIRDIASKALNLSFAAVEFILLYLILKPQIFIQTTPFYLLAFLISLGLAIFLFFTILFITSSVPFWAPEMGWGVIFLIQVIVIEFLSGSLFPIDILPTYVQSALYLTPFPYLIFFPLQIYLGKLSYLLTIKGLVVALIWVVTLWFTMKSVWAHGIKAYRSEGR